MNDRIIAVMVPRVAHPHPITEASLIMVVRSILMRVFSGRWPSMN